MIFEPCFPEHSVLPECLVKTVKNFADPVFLILILELNKEKDRSLISLDLDEVLLVNLFEDFHDVGVGEFGVIKRDVGKHPCNRVTHKREFLRWRSPPYLC